jgi:cytochrome P450
MIHFPDVQAKCQKEIKDVLGTDGDLRQLNLQKDLPYTIATLLETQRIASITAMSVPHKVRQDTTIAGYHIPKGILVLANIRFLHFDETKWVDPLEFNPDRWLDPSDPKKILQNANFIPFSLGKRRCLGESLAKTEYFTFGVHILSQLRVKMADPQNPPPLIGHGVVLMPSKFKIVVETI